MWRFFIVGLIALSSVGAQDNPEPVPSPSPSSSAAPSATPTAKPSDKAEPSDEAKPTEKENPAAEEAPAAEETPVPSAESQSAETPSAPAAEEPPPSPPPVEDSIPLEGETLPDVPVDGAPLDTQNLAPAFDPPTDQMLPDEAFTDPNAIIPDEPPPAPVPMGPSESVEQRARKLNIKYREARVVAEKDPDVQSLLLQANQAKTDEDRRAAYREYYRLLFKKIVAMNNELEEKCRIMEAAYLRRLAQERLEPTIPLNPPPTPAPLP